MGNGNYRPVEYDIDQNPHAVAVEEFQLPKDTLRSVLAEIITAQKPDSWIINQVCGVVAKQFAHEEIAIKTEGLRDVISQVLASPHPALRLAQIGFAAGLMKEDGPTLAKRYGVSKQAFQQGVEDVRETYQVRKIRVMRDDDARFEMQSSNFRHAVEKPDDEEDYFDQSEKPVKARMGRGGVNL